MAIRETIPPNGLLAAIEEHYGASWKQELIAHSYHHTQVSPFSPFYVGELFLGQESRMLALDLEPFARN